VKFKGYLLGIIAAVSFGLNPAFTLPLYADGMNPESVLLLRYGFSVPILALMMIATRRSFRVQKADIPQLLALGVLMAISSLTLFVSYKYMAAGIASTILFVYPIFVALIMSLLFKEKITLVTAASLLVATGGILLLYHTGDGGTLSTFGVVAVFISALTYAVYLVWMGKGRIHRMHSLTATFYVICVGTLVYAGCILFGSKPLTLPSSPLMTLDAFVLALLTTAISLLCTKAAIRLVGSTPVAILGALEPVTALGVGILFFNEGMTLREGIGVVMILAAVSAVVVKSES